jgi:DNA/RNA endonuclease G (NUC1)
MLKYDTRMRTPKWAFERFTSQDSELLQSTRGQVSRKNSNFKEDSRIAVPASRTKPDDFKGTGYDRGHMVPAGDCQQSQQAIDETFTMANVCPQDGALNKGFWSNFEAFKYDYVDVITGPIYAPTFDRVLNKWVYHFDITGTYPRHVAVPTHFFKVIKAKKSITTNDRKGNKNSDTLVTVGAFLIENCSVDKHAPISDFAVRIEDIEVLTGIRLFNDSLNTPARQFLDSCIPEEQKDISKLLTQDNSLKTLSDPSSNSANKATKDSNKKAGQLFGKADRYYGDRESADAPINRADSIVRIMHLCQVENCTKTWSKLKGSGDS